MQTKRPLSSVVTLSDFDTDVKVDVKKPDGVRYLFTTKTCPNCTLAKNYLKDIQYVVIDAMENTELATRYGVMQAPTLVEINGDEFTKYVGAPKIRKYAENIKMALV